ncbi:MAG: hypothetical protein ACKOPT_08875 [Cyanobium sp.]
MRPCLNVWLDLPSSTDLTCGTTFVKGKGRAAGSMCASRDLEFGSSQMVPRGVQLLLDLVLHPTVEGSSDR